MKHIATREQTVSVTFGIVDAANVENQVGGCQHVVVSRAYQPCEYNTCQMVDETKEIINEQQKQQP